MSTHTPGPWQCGSSYIEAEDGTIICETVVPMRFHDAKLMTAAPDMLAALENIRTAHQTNHNVAEAWGWVDAAIAKATGAA